MKELENLVKQTLRNKPDTIGNNTLLWFEVCKTLCIENDIEDIHDFFLNTLMNKLPTVHSIAAIVSILRKKYPEEFTPTEEQKQNKLEVQKQWVERYRNS